MHYKERKSTKDIFFAHKFQCLVKQGKPSLNTFTDDEVSQLVGWVEFNGTLAAKQHL